MHCWCGAIIPGKIHRGRVLSRNWMKEKSKQNPNFMVIPRYPGWPVTFWRNQFLSMVVQCFPMVVPCFLMVFQCVPMLSYQSHLFWWISGCCETNARALFEKGQSTVQRWDAPEVSSCNTCGWLQTSTLPWFFHRIRMGKPCWFPKSRYVHRCFTDVSLRWFMAKPLNSFTHPGYLVPQCYPVLTSATPAKWPDTAGKLFRNCYHVAILVLDILDILDILDVPWPKKNGLSSSNFKFQTGEHV